MLPSNFDNLVCVALWYGIVVARITAFIDSRWRDGIKLNTNVSGHLKHALLCNMVHWVPFISQKMHRRRRLPL